MLFGLIKKIFSMADDEYCRYRDCNQRELIEKGGRIRHRVHYSEENIITFNEASKELKGLINQALAKGLITQALAKGSMGNLAGLTEKRIKEIEIIQEGG